MGIGKSKNNQTVLSELTIKTTTWQRDSHGLFDYEGKESEKKQIKALGSGAHWIFHSSTITQNEEELEKNPESKLWRVVKYCKSKNKQIDGYKLLPNDLIKLGRVRFKVKDIQSPSYKKLSQRTQNKQKRFLEGKGITKRKNSQEQTDIDPNQLEINNNLQIEIIQNQHNDNFSEKDEKIQYKNEAGHNLNHDGSVFIIKEDNSVNYQSNQSICRICLGEDNELVNPLFSPCKCSGTMKYIHLECLQEWLNSRKIIKESLFAKTYFWKTLECELCKTIFPNSVKTSQSDESLNLRFIQYDTPVYQQGLEPHYLILESVSSNTSKVVHVLNMIATDEIKIGRGHETDMRVTDISVSRLHALIRKSQKGYYYIEDNHSKFGTLALVKSPIQMIPQEINYIQAGRTMLEIQIKRPSVSLSICICLKANKKKINMAKQGLVSQNGVDYFPEEFLPDSTKLKKKTRKINGKQQKLIKIEKVNNIPTAFHSEINIEEAGNQGLNRGISNIQNNQQINDDDNENSDSRVVAVQVIVKSSITIPRHNSLQLQKRDPRASININSEESKQQNGINKMNTYNMGKQAHHQESEEMKTSKKQKKRQQKNCQVVNKQASLISKNRSIKRGADVQMLQSFQSQDFQQLQSLNFENDEIQEEFQSCNSNLQIMNTEVQRILNENHLTDGYQDKQSLEDIIMDTNRPIMCDQQDKNQQLHHFQEQHNIRYFEEQKNSQEMNETQFYKNQKSIAFMQKQLKNNQEEVCFLQGTENPGAKNDKTEYLNSSRLQSLADGGVGQLFTKNFFDDESDVSKQHDFGCVRPSIGGGDSNQPTGRRIDKVPTSYCMSSPSKFRNNKGKNNQLMTNSDNRKRDQTNYYEEELKSNIKQVQSKQSISNREQRLLSNHDQKNDNHFKLQWHQELNEVKEDDNEINSQQQSSAQLINDVVNQQHSPKFEEKQLQITKVMQSDQVIVAKRDSSAPPSSNYAKSSKQLVKFQDSNNTDLANFRLKKRNSPNKDRLESIKAQTRSNDNIINTNASYPVGKNRLLHEISQQNKNKQDNTIESRIYDVSNELPESKNKQMSNNLKGGPLKGIQFYNSLSNVLPNQQIDHNQRNDLEDVFEDENDY